MNKKDNNLEVGWNLEHTYARLPQLFYKPVSLSRVSSPQLVVLNESLATELGLSIEALQHESNIAILAGNDVPEGVTPLAQAYAGHQYGNFTMLGDGRALLFGEHTTPQGKSVDIQLKGSGLTPFSRGGDGRAALGPMLREYIISEAMVGLGIPTTRSLAVVASGESVFRETVLQGAVLTRVAASHLRVGTFEYASQWGTIEDVRILADYTIERHFPDVKDGEHRYLHLLQQVINRQAMLIAKWQLVGFIHGVMNTDNMAISGETIDYGPCAFMDNYDPATVFSSIDRQGRYAYGNQPNIGGWNLARFAETLVPLLDDNQSEAIEIAQEALSQYKELYSDAWLTGMRRKLGISNEEEQDQKLIEDLLVLMDKAQADYTNTFVALTFNKLEDNDLFQSSEFTRWHTLWQERLVRQGGSDESVHQVMRNHNPAVIPRNHRVEEAIKVAVEEGDYSIMKQLLDVLSNTYAHTPEQTLYASLPTKSTSTYRTFCGT
ncbi:protein adenylyltransferase SelO [Paenibacillus sp. CMAA1364]